MSGECRVFAAGAQRCGYERRSMPIADTALFVEACSHSEGTRRRLEDGPARTRGVLERRAALGVGAADEGAQNGRNITRAVVVPFPAVDRIGDLQLAVDQEEARPRLRWN